MMNVFAIVGIIIATWLGIDAQGIAYFLHDLFPQTDTVIILVILTITSVSLFILIPTLTFFSKKIVKKMWAYYFVSCFMIGIPTSVWSLFVMLMWMH
ncbi:hypothetical protein ACLIA0_07930 [Bacillaceae bacterium W0354]